MNLIEHFEIAGGSIPGTEHTKPGRPGWKNNQDAFAWKMSPEVIVGTICDGCGSSKHSEVGAKLACKMLTEIVFSTVKSNVIGFNKDHIVFIKLIEDILLKKIKSLSLFMTMSSNSNESIIPVVHDYFLFTTIFFVITNDKTYIFALGDGIYSINDAISYLGPFENNCPPYLSYRIKDRQYETISLSYNGLFKIKKEVEIPTLEVKNLLIGTDGLSYFIDNESMIISRTGRPLGHISQFWKENRYFSNNDSIRRILAVSNNEYVDGKLIKGGPLHDDTTLVVVRAKQGERFL